MSESDKIPDILTVNKSRGCCRFSFERLREISICLSNLNINVKLPIFEVLIEQEDLQKPLNNYKSVLLNCILDCIRLALPISPDFFDKIKLENFPGKLNKHKDRSKQTNAQIISEIVLYGLIEHIESILESFKSNIGKDNDPNKILSKYSYSLERSTENNCKVLIFLIENIHESLRKNQSLLIFDMLLDLFENSTLQNNTEILNISKHAISNIFSYSDNLSIKNEFTLSFLVKLINLFKTSKCMEIYDILSHICAILSDVGVSGISYFTNTILTESVRFLRSKTKCSFDFKSLQEKESNWWKDKSTLFPVLLRKVKYDKVKEIQLAVIYVIHFLGSINEEYIQSVISQMICDLRETNDQLRLETVKMVTKLIMLDFKSEFYNIFQRFRIEIQFKQDEKSKLKNQLIESWLSRSNDRQIDIRKEIIEGILEALNTFIERSEFGYYCERFIEFIIEQDDIINSNKRESLIKVVSDWLAIKQNEPNSSKLINDSIQYLLKHISDQDRGIRMHLVKYLKGYIEIPELSRNLWLLWYISFKQKDLQMRATIEDVLLEINQLETIESYFPNYKIPQTRYGIKTTDNKSNMTIYRIIKTFNYQRHALLKNFRLLICSLYLIQLHKHTSLDKYVESLKLEIITQIEYFFLYDTNSGGDTLKYAKDMLSQIQNSLVSKEIFTNWANILGISVSKKETQIENFIRSMELDQPQVFKQIIRYLGTFNFNPEKVNCKVLCTIFSPNNDPLIEKLETEDYNESLITNKLDEMILRLQFKYKINVLSYILSNEKFISLDGEELSQVLNNAIKLFNHQEIFKLYESFYFNSSNLFRRKLLKYLVEINSVFKNISEIFNRPFVDNCFTFGECKKKDFFTEIIPRNEFRIIIKDIIYQIFPSIPISGNFCRDSDFKTYLESNLLKKKNKHLSNEQYLELYLLRLYTEKIRTHELLEVTDYNALLSQLIFLIEESLTQSELEEYWYILITKLFGVGCLLLSKISSPDESLFNKFFEIYYNFNKMSKPTFGMESSLSKPHYKRLYLESKLFYNYLAYKIENSLNGWAGIHQYSLKENILIFNIYIYFELTKYICFSDQKNFFRKSHLRLLELGKEFCDNGPELLNMMMNSQILNSDKDGNGRNILSTALGRSIGISFIPILIQQFSKEVESQKVYEEIEKSIERMINIFLDSVIHSSTIKYDQLYCVLDCIISVFLYYISQVDNFNLKSTNNSIHCFVKIIYGQLFEKLKKIENVSEQLTTIGIYCIALLDEIGSKYSFLSNSVDNLNENSVQITTICKGIQFHISYFFVSNEDPEIFTKENTDIFDHWNYIKSSYKFRVPSYLFSKTTMESKETVQDYFKWNVPKVVQSKSIKEKETKKSRSKKVRKVADLSVTIDCENQNYENLVRNYDKYESDSSHSSLSENDDENWNGNSSLKIEISKELRRSNRLKLQKT